MRQTIWTIGLTAFLAAGVAAADDDEGDKNVFVKGGVSAFTGDLAAYSEAGPSYGVTLNLQPFNVVGIELGYEGSRNEIEDDRAQNGLVARNGVSAMLKVAPPFIERVKPFVAAGLGASYLSVRNGAALYGNDYMQEIPLAAGIEFNAGMLTAGARGTYRVLIDEDFANEAEPTGDPEGGLFDATLTLGARF